MYWKGTRPRTWSGSQKCACISKYRVNRGFVQMWQCQAGVADVLEREAGPDIEQAARTAPALVSIGFIRICVSISFIRICVSGPWQ